MEFLRIEDIRGVGDLRNPVEVYKVVRGGGRSPRRLGGPVILPGGEYRKVGRFVIVSYSTWYSSN